MVSGGSSRPVYKYPYLFFSLIAYSANALYQFVCSREPNLNQVVPFKALDESKQIISWTLQHT